MDLKAESIKKENFFRVLYIHYNLYNQELVLQLWST